MVAADITPIILTISAVSALFAIWRNQVIAARRASIDLVLNQNGDLFLLEEKKLFLSLRSSENGDCLAQYASSESKDSKEASAIKAVLNNYEFIASGIREKAFCEKTYKRMQYGVLVRDYKALQGFIHEIRLSRKHPTLFKEFEWLGKRWENCKLN